MPVPGLTLPHAGALEPTDKKGDWGVNVRWRPDWLDGTLGFYYRKFDERQPWSAPQVVARPGGFYRLVYALGTELYGIGLNKNIGGVAVSAEVSYRKNTAFINSAINPTTLEGPRGDSWHAFVNGTMLGNLAAGVSYTAVGELVYSRWDKVRSNPESVQRRRVPGLYARQPGAVLCDQGLLGRLGPVHAEVPAGHSGRRPVRADVLSDRPERKRRHAERR